MDAIETKEIRGLSIRALAWLISSTVTIVAFVVTSYFLLKTNVERVDAKIDQVKSDKISDDRYNDLRLRVLEANVEAVKIQVDNLRNQVSTNSEQIKTR